MSLIEHLSELRTRIVYAVLAIVAGSILAGFFTNSLLEFMTQSLREITAPEEYVNQLLTQCSTFLTALSRGETKEIHITNPQIQSGVQACGVLFSLPRSLQVIHPTEAIFTLLKLILMVGLLISAPFVIHQIWLFVIPALFQNEKKYIGYGVLSGTLLFYTGAAFAYFVVFPFAVRFLKSIGEPFILAQYTLANYVSFMLFFVIGFGLAFELPLVLLVLAKLGIVTADFLRSKWKYATIIILAAAAIITPTPDPYTMMTLAVPMMLLYELSIWLIRWFVKEKPESTLEGEVAAEKGA
jgi:sec-independent protein translocase protein TatC